MKREQEYKNMTPNLKYDQLVLDHRKGGVSCSRIDCDIRKAVQLTHRMGQTQTSTVLTQNATAVNRYQYHTE